MNGLISFGGGSLINFNDLRGLFGNSEKQEDNWLSNFVIDTYLSLIQSGDTKINLLTLSWELFEKGKTYTIASYLTTKNALNQDLILIPCNPIQSSHWYLLAVFPKEKLVVVLDSLAGNYVKPSTERTLTKISNVLIAIEPNCNIAKSGPLLSIDLMLFHNKVTHRIVGYSPAYMEDVWLGLAQW